MRRGVGQVKSPACQPAGSVHLMLVGWPLSPALRQYAQLEKAVVLVGQGKKFEIWNQEQWDARMDAPGGLAPGGLPPELEGFSL